MTLNDWQNYLHAVYQGDTDTPTEGTEDWDFREILLRAAIQSWDNEKGILWGELWKQLSDASDGDKTVVAVTVEYDCPIDFRFPGNYVRTTDASGVHTFWPVVKPAKAELFKNESATICWFTGNKQDGFDLHFGEQPTAGHTINYPYYKEPDIPSVAADIIEMADPWFAIHHSLSTLRENDGEGDRAGLELAKAEAKIKNMRTRNVMPAWYQDNYVPDRDFETGTPGFGV